MASDQYTTIKEQGPPMSTPSVICPVCGENIELAPMPAVSEATLASVFGPGVMQAVAATRTAEENEQRLRKHMESHTIEDFLTAIRKRDQIIDALPPKANGGQMRDEEAERDAN